MRTQLRVAFLFIFCGGVLFVRAGRAQAPAKTISRADLTTVYSDRSVEERDLTHRDARLLYMEHTGTQFSLSPYDSKSAWEQRAQHLRERVLWTAGLWPLPEKTPLNARIFGRIDHENYSVEKVYFESYPDFFVAGNLYRPRGKDGPFPGVLSPHGHWSRGRLNHTERGSVPARAINLARQGYVVLTYDMVGYGDTRQVSHSFAADSLSQLRGINLLGLQLWDSIRALDLLASLPNVDTTRLGMTGASGGATQTFLLTAADRADRVKATAPVNMISTRMQGGSLCENAPGLRLNTFNVELAALTVPRPMLMVANTHDWTAMTPKVEYPLMKSFYELYGAEDRLGMAYFDYRHNYNKASRNAVYPWLARWLKGADHPETYQEEPVTVEDDEDLLVFLEKAITDPDSTYEEIPDSLHRPLPADLDADALKRNLRERWRAQLESYWPEDYSSWRRFKEVYGTGLEHMLAADRPDQVRVEHRGQTAGPDFTVERALLARAGTRDWIPAVTYRPPNPSAEATLVVSPRGKAGLVQSGRAEPVPAVRQLLEQGHRVLAIDPFKVGEHGVPDGTTTQRDESFEFFTTFNRTNTQHRVQDLLTAAAHLKAQPGIERVNLLGLDRAGVWALLANGEENDLFDKTGTYGLDVNPNGSTEALNHFVPGLLRLGGFETVVALSAPSELFLHDVGGGFDETALSEVYSLVGAPGALKIHTGETNLARVIDWLDK